MLHLNKLLFAFIVTTQILWVVSISQAETKKQGEDISVKLAKQGCVIYDGINNRKQEYLDKTSFFVKFDKPFFPGNIQGILITKIDPLNEGYVSIVLSTVDIYESVKTFDSYNTNYRLPPQIIKKDVNEDGKEEIVVVAFLASNCLSSRVMNIYKNFEESNSSNDTIIEPMDTSIPFYDIYKYEFKDKRIYFNCMSDDKEKQEQYPPYSYDIGKYDVTLSDSREEDYRIRAFLCPQRTKRERLNIRSEWCLKEMKRIKSRLNGTWMYFDKQ